MKKHKLEVEKRKTTGKKVKNLRREGVLPANIYGKKIKSLPVQLPLKDFDRVFKEVGETGLLELSVAGEDKARPVLIHNVQLDPLTSLPLHTDFFQVDLKEKVTTMAPLEITGEALAVKEKKGVLLHTLNGIEVEALPTDLPEKIEVDVSQLAEVDQEIKVSDLKVPPRVTVLTEAGLVVCKISPLITAEMEAEIKKEKEETAAVAAEAAVERGEEAPPVEGEAPPAPEGAPAPEGVSAAAEGKPAKEKPAPETPQKE